MSIKTKFIRKSTVRDFAYLTKKKKPTLEKIIEEIKKKLPKDNKPRAWDQNFKPIKVEICPNTNH